MHLESISIRDFRNLRKVDYQPHSGLNILIGDNAQGKTNFLEAISVLVNGGSFRSSGDNNLINYGCSAYTIKSKYRLGDRFMESSLQYKRNGSKTLMLNNKKSSFSHPDRLRVVLFTPDDLFLIKGSPSQRRFFLDFVLKQLSIDYFLNIDNYVNILKKRNLLIKKEQTSSRTFELINSIFVDYAVKVILQRISFVGILDEIANEIHQKINKPGVQLKIRYALSFEVDSDRINFNILQNALKSELIKRFKDEVRRKATLVGPHLDDIHFYLDGKMARLFASQGQQRNIVISLKLSEMEAYKRIKNYYPLFLLDEVLAELDQYKKNLLLIKLAEAPFQTFLTSVSPDLISGTERGIVLVKNGELTRKE